MEHLIPLLHRLVVLFDHELVAILCRRDILLPQRESGGLGRFCRRQATLRRFIRGRDIHPPLGDGCGLVPLSRRLREIRARDGFLIRLGAESALALCHDVLGAA